MLKHDERVDETVRFIRNPPLARGMLPTLARTADAAERAELWPMVVAAYYGYAIYQHRTSREIPLVICEPRS